MLTAQRLGGIDHSPGVIPSALAVMAPPNPASTSFPPARPRWEPLQTELWLGGIDKYNSKMEGYEAITCLEVIEHLDPNLLSRFGVNTMGTYRPRLLLVTTPVRLFHLLTLHRQNVLARDPDADVRTSISTQSSPRRATTTTTTQRKDSWTRQVGPSVFLGELPTWCRTFALTTRHSDHKCEMTSGEFREWATAAAADWG